MKTKEVRFGRPAKLLQVYRMVHEYGKEQKSFAERTDKLDWKEIPSVSGYVENGELFLPAEITGDPKFGNCGLITLEDQCDVTPQRQWKLINGRYHKGDNHCFNLHHPNRYEMFGFDKDPLELWLRYQYWLVGDPSRENFKLADLEKDQAVEVKINGKIDSSYGRYFVERYYIFQYLGEFARCRLFKSDEGTRIKRVPPERRLVDLWKPLW